jgi:hypothetical protein
MVCSTCASAGSGGNVVDIPGVVAGFPSAGFASPAGFASCEASASGAGCPARCPTAATGAIAGTTAKRHDKTTNFDKEKYWAEIMFKILHTSSVGLRYLENNFSILKL